MLVPTAVQAVMQSPVDTVPPSATVRTAAERLTETGSGSLVVCEGSEPVGILTDTDVTALIARAGDPGTTTVSDAMSRPVITVELDTPVEDAAARLREHDIAHLPVVDDGAIVGMVTATDLALYLPHIATRHAEHPPDLPPRTNPRVDTAYARDDWTFAYHGDETAIDVGDTVRFSKTLDADDVAAFAEASGDTNRLHLDAAYARETRFGERIAHGTLVGGTISAALARLPGLTIYLSQDISYLGPVPLDTRVTASCTVVEAIGPDRYRLTTGVERDDGEPVIEGEATVLSDPLPDLS